MAGNDRIDVASEGRSTLRDRILKVASDLFASRGYAGTSVREVAEAAGCTKPALYYHFENKEELFHEVVRSHTEFITKIVEKFVGAERSVRERAVEGLRLYFEHVRSDPVSVRLLRSLECQTDDEGPRVDLQSFRRQQAALMEAILAEGVRAGEIRDDVDLEDAVWAVVGLVDVRLQLWQEGVPLAGDLHERIVRILFDGIGK